MYQPLDNPTNKEMIGYWRLDEGSGQVAYDLSGHNHNGRLGSYDTPDNDDPIWLATSWPHGDSGAGDSVLYFSKRDTSNEDYDLYTIRPDPVNPNLQSVPMNDSSGDQKYPVVSPDGRFVLYAIGSAAYQSFQVWVLDRLTGQRQYLFEGLAQDRHPSGQRFVFIPNAFCSTTIREAFVSVTPTGLVITSTRLVFDCAPDHPAGALGV